MFDRERAKQVEIFLFEAPPRVMLLLIQNVPTHLINLGPRVRKRAVAFLLFYKQGAPTGLASPIRLAYPLPSHASSGCWKRGSAGGAARRRLMTTDFEAGVLLLSAV
jgi:hypothetical protein